MRYILCSFPLLPSAPASPFLPLFYPLPPLPFFLLPRLFAFHALTELLFSSEHTRDLQHSPPPTHPPPRLPPSLFLFPAPRKVDDRRRERLACCHLEPHGERVSRFATNWKYLLNRALLRGSRRRSSKEQFREMFKAQTSRATGGILRRLNAQVTSSIGKYEKPGGSCPRKLSYARAR